MQKLKVRIKILKNVCHVTAAHIKLDITALLMVPLVYSGSYPFFTVSSIVVQSGHLVGGH